MAIKELFYDNRPQVLFDPRASKRIDPRFKFTRASTASFVDKDGVLQAMGAAFNTPRFDYDPATKEFLGLLIEPARTNSIANNTMQGAVVGTPGTLPTGWVINASSGLSTAVVATGTEGGIAYIDLNISGTPTATLYQLSFSGNTDIAALPDEAWSGSSWLSLAAGSVTNIEDIKLRMSPRRSTGGGLAGTDSPEIALTSSLARSSVIANALPADTAYVQLAVRFALTVSAAVDITLRIGLPQLEKGPSVTSAILTTSAAVTRSADLLSVEAPLPSSGSIYVDARALSANENDTLASIKNSSDEKIDLAYLSNASTYDSLALIANYDGTSKTSLPLPVPTTDRERNIITWGANNYQYGRDSSRFAASLSSSVPASLNKLSIGHDAVDPTKGFHGYVNTIYAWSGELTPAVAEALVRNELDPIDADTYSPTGPAGSLALVINTQGASADGDKTFTLPAESAATDNDIVITWGDGTESGLDGSDAELGAAGLTHTYPSAGIYPVWVEGKMENIQYANISNAPDLLEITEWGTGDMFTAPSTMVSAFYGCTQMDFSSSARNTNLPDTSAVTNWSQAFYDCSSITGTFPALDLSAATSFIRTWRGCSSMTAFIAAGDQTQNVTNFQQAWMDCTSLTNFPQINTSAGENFESTWRGCTALTSFPSIITSNGTSFFQAWYICTSLETFPLLNTSSGTNFDSTWRGCSSLDNITNAGDATSFPQIDTAAGQTFNRCWENCSSFTNFPALDTSSGTIFSYAWANCSSLTNFPSIVTSAGTNFDSTWRGCSGLTSFPLLDVSAGTTFNSAWYNCGSLSSFPANFFDSWSGTPADGCFYLTWDLCSSLTPASVVNILDSIAASGQSAPSGTGTGDKEITIDWDGTGDPATDAAAAITTLKSRNWDVVLNGVSQ